MIWSAKKHYYLGFWAFLELKLVNIFIKTGLYFRHSEDIISTCYVYENRRKWFRSPTFENVACQFEIRFFFFLIILFVVDDLHLQIIEIISPQSIRPVRYI